MFGIALAIGSMVGLAVGGAKAYARKVEYDEKLKDLKQKQADLTETYKNTVFNARL